MLLNSHLTHSPRWLAVAGALGLAIAMAPGAVAQLPEIPAEDTSSTESTDPVADDVRFSCRNVNGEYTVMYHPDGQGGQGYAWATPTALGGGWTRNVVVKKLAVVWSPIVPMAYWSWEPTWKMAMTWSV